MCYNLLQSRLLFCTKNFLWIKIFKNIMVIHRCGLRRGTDERGSGADGRRAQTGCGRRGCTARGLQTNLVHTQ